MSTKAIGKHLSRKRSRISIAISYTQARISYNFLALFLSCFKNSSYLCNRSTLMMHLQGVSDGWDDIDGKGVC